MSEKEEITLQEHIQCIRKCFPKPIEEIEENAKREERQQCIKELLQMEVYSMKETQIKLKMIKLLGDVKTEDKFTKMRKEMIEFVEKERHTTISSMNIVDCILVAHLDSQKDLRRENEIRD